MIQVSKPLSWILQQSISQPQETYTNWLSQVFLNLTLLILQCLVVLQTRKGTLSFMLSRETHDDIDPSLTALLSKMGINIFPCGATHGTGLAAKLANNYLWQSQTLLLLIHFNWLNHLV